MHTIFESHVRVPVDAETAGIEVTFHAEFISDGLGVWGGVYTRYPELTIVRYGNNVFPVRF